MSENWKVVKEKSGKVEKVREMSGEIMVSFCRPAKANTLNNERKSLVSFVCLIAVPVPLL